MNDLGFEVDKGIAKAIYEKGYADGSLSVREQILERKEKEIKAKILEKQTIIYDLDGVGHRVVLVKDIK